MRRFRYAGDLRGTAAGIRSRRWRPPDPLLIRPGRSWPTLPVASTPRSSRTRTEGAETLILAMGSLSETASLAVDIMREQGKKVGLVKLRLWRPLPVDDLRKAFAGAKDVVVLDRSVSVGAANAPVTSEMAAPSCTTNRKDPISTA